jgi:endonuclease/exonuclease/phosphatase family metal-dependent hydrolase
MLSAFAVQAQADTERVRLASWNINNLNEISDQPLRSRAPARPDDDYLRLAQYGSDIGADVIALQEMGSPGAVRRVFAEADWEMVFSQRYDETAPADIYTAMVFRKGPVDVLSSDTVDSLAIPDGDYSTRAGVEALIEVNGQQMWLLNVHLKSGCFAGTLINPRTDDCEIAAQQPAPLEAWIDEKEQTGLPVIVLGDFNRKFDVHMQNDHIWGEIDDAEPASLNLWRVPFRTSSNCPTTRPRDREVPVDYIVMNQPAWDMADEQSFTEYLYDEQDAEDFGNRLSDHCPISIDLLIAN